MKIEASDRASPFTRIVWVSAWPIAVQGTKEAVKTYIQYNSVRYAPSTNSRDYAIGIVANVGGEPQVSPVRNASKQPGGYSVVAWPILHMKTSGREFQTTIRTDQDRAGAFGGLGGSGTGALGFGCCMRLR
jgi:hypothetical protein